MKCLQWHFEFVGKLTEMQNRMRDEIINKLNYNFLLQLRPPFFQHFQIFLCTMFWSKSPSQSPMKWWSSEENNPFMKFCLVLLSNYLLSFTESLSLDGSFCPLLPCARMVTKTFFLFSFFKIYPGSSNSTFPQKNLT